MFSTVREDRYFSLSCMKQLACSVLPKRFQQHLLAKAFQQHPERKDENYTLSPNVLLNLFCGGLGMQVYVKTKH